MDHAAECRALCAHQQYGMLSTLAREPVGYPFGSLVAYVPDERGQPLLLLSGLAEHTANLQADSRASLLICDVAPLAGPGEDDEKRAPEGANPLAQGRATLIGRVHAVTPEDVEAARRRYLARHPEAELYLQLPDFEFYRLAVAGVRYVGGFGRMSWISGEAYAGVQEK